jgi:mannosyltransferase OCH1-like enzyme
VAEIMESWRLAHPGWKIDRFDNASALVWLQNTAPEALRAYRATKDLTQKSDILRLAVLAREGGWYADVDDRCLAPVSTLQTGAANFVAYQEEYGTLGTNVIGVQPGHPVILAALEEAIRAMETGASDIIWLSTGPGLLSRSFTRVLLSHVTNRAEFLENTAILTRPELRRAIAPHCHAHYKLAGQHWGDTQFRRVGRLAPK